ncbi:hypothetical protein DP117_19810 [Brasilonema sp. UFV-L1]|nr:hypothetical protein [Brasilonema sp. UFV-L1]
MFPEIVENSDTPVLQQPTVAISRGRGSNTKKFGSLCFVDLSSKPGTRCNKAAKFLGDNASGVPSFQPAIPLTTDLSTGTVGASLRQEVRVRILYQFWSQLELNILVTNNTSISMYLNVV